MILYDIEIKHGIMPKKKSDVLPDIGYCKDWDDHKNMGISVVCAYDYASSKMLAFSDDILNLDGSLIDFQYLVWSADVVVGYNNIKFDDVVCRACGIDIPEDKSYDILREVWYSAGLSHKFNKLTHGGFGLDAVAKANGITESKLASGADAPIWFQHKEYDKLVEYCKQDVLLTKQVMDKLLNTRSLLHPKTFRTLKVRLPLNEVSSAR